MLDMMSVTARAAHSCYRLLSWRYRGPLIRVRRSSDNATLDVYARGQYIDFAALTQFAGVSSLFVGILYDQSGNGLNLTAPSNGQQPRIVNAGTFETAGASKLVMVFDGTDDELSRPDAMGLTGSPALTVGMCWSASSNQKDPWTLGETTGGSDARVSTYTDNARSNTSMLWGQGANGREHTLPTVATSFNSYTAARAAAATAHSASVVLRQNGAACTSTGNTGSNSALNMLNQFTAIGRTTWTYVACKWNHFAVFNAVLAADDLLAAEIEQGWHR